MPSPAGSMPKLLAVWSVLTLGCAPDTAPSDSTAPRLLIEGALVLDGTGTYADLVLFDPETVADRATPEEPNATSIGIDWVMRRADASVDAGERSSCRIRGGRRTRSNTSRSFETRRARSMRSGTRSIRCHGSVDSGHSLATTRARAPIPGSRWRGPSWLGEGS